MNHVVQFSLQLHGLTLFVLQFVLCVLKLLLSVCQLCLGRAQRSLCTLEFRAKLAYLLLLLFALRFELRVGVF